MNEESREYYLSLCPAFGLDEEGVPGQDMTSKECQSCREENKPLWEACHRECTGEVEQEEQEEQETSKDTNVDEKDVDENEERSPVPEEAFKEQETKSEPTRKAKTVIQVIADVLRETAENPMKLKDIIEEVQKRTGKTKSTAQTLSHPAVKFAEYLELVERTDDKKYKWVR